MPPWLLTVEGELGITLLLWQAGHPLAPGFPLVWVLVWAYLLLILSTWDMLAYVHFLLLCDIIASYYFSFFVLFLMVQKNAYVWYYFLCRVVSVRVFWRKSYELEWLGCGACGGVTSSPADLPPPLIILCVFATCVQTHHPHGFVVTCSSLCHSFIVMS